MSRIGPTNITNIDEVVINFAEHKHELDTYKKMCDEENSQIKKFLLDTGETEHIAGGHKVKLSTRISEKLNEDAILQVAKQFGIEDAVIETKEYVNLDKLEAYLYNNTVSPEFADAINKCRETKTTYALSVSKVKE